MAAFSHRSAAPAIALLLGAVSATPPASGEAWATNGRLTGRIVFASDADGDLELFVMRADGSRRRRLTRNHVHDYDPSWSPDRHRVIFTRYSPKDSTENLFILDLRRDRPARPWLALRDTHEGDASWSPAGKWIAYRGNESIDGSDVIVMRIDKSDGRVIASQEDNSSNEDPAYSPDGRRVALAEFFEEGEILIRTPFTADEGERIARDSAIEHDLDWSPAGDCLLYTREVGDRYDVMSISVDGGQPRLLHSGDRVAIADSWSPDAEHWISHAKRDLSDQYDLYIGETRSAEVRPLTRTPEANEIDADWHGRVEPPNSTFGCAAPAASLSPSPDLTDLLP